MVDVLLKDAQFIILYNSQCKVLVRGVQGVLIFEPFLPIELRFFVLAIYTFLLDYIFEIQW